MKAKSSKFFKIIAFSIMLLLCIEQSGLAQIAGQLDISGHLTALRSSLISDTFRPLHLRYLQYNSLNNSFQLFLDKGSLKSPQTQELENTTKTLLNYFFIGVTLPNESFWVNLRPDAEDNIIDEQLAQTDVGKILLESDLQLKKDTAKFTSPETPEGKEYWDKLYKKAEEIFGSENITIPTLTRPWIVPDEIIIRETVDSAYIYKATLKVMLEQDYLKDSTVYNFKDDRLKELNEYSSQLIREIIIPKLTKEVNSSKRYASLRQVYYSLIMAQWFKARFYDKSGLYSRLIDRKSLIGLTSKEGWSKTTYFKEYQKSFKDGEYNIQEPVYTPYGQTIRSYFSGGTDLNLGLKTAFGAEAVFNPKKPNIFLEPASGSPVVNNEFVLGFEGKTASEMYKVDLLPLNPKTEILTKDSSRKEDAKELFDSIIRIANLPEPAGFSVVDELSSLSGADDWGDVLLLKWIIEQYEKGRITKGELAWLIAHEVAHLEKGQPKVWQLKNLLRNIQVNKVAPSRVRWDPDLVVTEEGIQERLQNLEHEADQRGTELTLKLGYPIEDAISMISKLQDLKNEATREGKIISKDIDLKDHPDIKDRIDYVLKNFNMDKKVGSESASSAVEGVGKSVSSALTIKEVLANIEQNIQIGNREDEKNYPLFRYIEENYSQIPERDLPSLAAVTMKFLLNKMYDALNLMGDGRPHIMYNKIEGIGYSKNIFGLLFLFAMEKDSQTKIEDYNILDMAFGRSGDLRAVFLTLFSNPANFFLPSLGPTEDLLRKRKENIENNIISKEEFKALLNKLSPERLKLVKEFMFATPGYFTFEELGILFPEQEIHKFMAQESGIKLEFYSDQIIPRNEARRRFTEIMRSIYKPESGVIMPEDAMLLPDHRAILAVDNNSEIIGFIHYTSNGFINEVAILPGKQGGGVGTKMLEAAIYDLARVGNKEALLNIASYRDLLNKGIIYTEFPDGSKISRVRSPYDFYLSFIRNHKGYELIGGSTGEGLWGGEPSRLLFPKEMVEAASREALIYPEQIKSASPLEEIQRKKVSSPLDTRGGKTVERPGGIDFRSLPIVTQAISNLSANIGNLSLNRLSDVNLDEEWQEIEKMSNSGITPSAERIKEYIQASCFKGNVAQDIDKVILCISDVLRLEEERCSLTDPLLKDILVMLESVRQPQELTQVFLGKTVF